MPKIAIFAVVSVVLLAPPASGLDDVQNFLAQGVDGAVVLSWENPAGADYAGVIIRRSAGAFPADVNDGDPVGPFPTGDFPVSQTCYVDDGLANGTSYYYAAFAHDNLMNPAAGVTASASTTQAVTNFQAASGDYEIALSWNMPTDATPNFVGVVIRRSSDAYPQTVAEGDLLVTVAAQPDPVDYASYVDTNVVLFETYYYSAFAHYYFAPPVDVYGPPVSVDQVPDDLTAPAPVQNFAALSGEDGFVPLSWDMPPYGEDWERVVVRSREDYAPVDASDGWLVEYYLRPTDDPGTPAVDESCDYPLSWDTWDGSVLNNHTYYYSIFVLDETGNESVPATAEATPVDVTAPDVPQLAAQPVIHIPWPEEPYPAYPAVELSWYVDVSVEPNWDLSEIVILRKSWPEGEEPADPYPVSRDDPDAEWVYSADHWSGFTGQFYDEWVEVGVTYYYAAWAIDDEFPPNVSGRATAEATPVENFPPEILSVTATPSGPPHEALIEWILRELDPTLCEISHGTTPGYHLGTIVEADYSRDMARSAVIDGFWGGTTIYFRIIATDDRGASSMYEGSFDTVLDSSEDTDGDGMADAWEIEYFGDLGTADATTNSEDTDGDGIADHWELERFGDLVTADATTHPDAPPSDSLTDLQEYQYGTDPTRPDTDGDGVPDDEEIANGSDPRTAPPLVPDSREGCGSLPDGPSPASVLVALLFVSVLRRQERAR